MVKFEHVDAGAGTMRRRIAEFDWSKTPLGPLADWPISLRAIVDMMLASSFPHAICWGDELTTIHNDAFLPILGEKPSALGQPFSRVWAEAWTQIGPIAEKAYRGEPTFIENYPLVIDRHGFHEEAYFTFCYSPLRGDDGEIAGLIDTVIETTATVRGEQRIRDSEARFRAFTDATTDVIYRMSPDWTEMRQLDGRSLLADTDTPSLSWQEDYLHAEDVADIRKAIGAAIAGREVFELEHRVRQADGKSGWILSRAVPVLDAKGEVVEWFGAATDISERKAAEDRQNVINREMSHRLKNTLAMVQAIATQTLRPSNDRHLVEALEKRIQALSSAHDILFDRYWHKAPIRSLIASTLQRVVPSERLDLEGGNVTIGPKGALSLSLVLHEMATNAVKYGALSNETGRVGLSWHVEGIGEDAVFRFVWTETGGPPASEPSRKGFGSKLIRMGLIGTGGVETSYEPSGFKAEMTALLYQLQHTE